jgi:tripartite ATP-independent transporter DctP family solute receptor
MSIETIRRCAPSRRKLLVAGAALPLVSIISRRGYAAEFAYKWASGQDPTHPINTRAQEAIDRIREKSGGRLDMQVFPANQLGSDTDLLSQVRSGGVEFFNLATSILATLVPAAGITNTGFAFPDYATVWKAMDGALGEYIRAQIGKAGLVAAFRFTDNGFRNVTTSTRPIKVPDDLKGLKIRVPPAPMLTSVFQALGAAPTPINFNELYSALQTKIVEGQENPLAIIATTKLYEVQKYCAMTGHTWDGYVILGNRRAWERLPQDLKDICTREFNASAEDQRADVAKLSVSLRQDLTAKGLEFNDVDRPAFRGVLRKTTFYQDWRGKYGDEAWGLLEAAVGKLT